MMGTPLTVPPLTPLPYSDTNRFPALSQARPVVVFNSDPEAKVVRTPSGVNFRILLLPPSTTNRSPARLKARALGKLNPRAKVVRTPSGVNLQMVPLMLPPRPAVESDTNRSPARLKARALGKLNPRAKVVRTPSGVNL